MARVLINEPHPDVQSLLGLVVRRLGHEPVLSDGTREQLLDVEAYVFEPGDEVALGLAVWARTHAPAVALVCTSIFPPSAETDALAPLAYLVKPFPLHRLESALRAALAADAAAT
jgi:hypothetical protein